MRILVTGANGQLGQQLLASARQHDLVACYHSAPPPGWNGPAVQVDLTSPASLEEALRTAKPDWIVHAAAMTNVDACEQNPALAMQTNGEATGTLARAAAAHGARFVYLSTDYVFDGTEGNYREDAKPNPIQIYGISKLAGEEAAMQEDPTSVIARTSVVYGPHKKNFVTWVIGELRAGRSIRIVDDQFVTPTLTLDLSEQILALIEADAQGTFHTAGGTSVSRLEMVQQIAKVFHLDASLVHAIRSSDLAWVAKRPMNSTLDTSKVSKYKPPLSLKASLDQMKEYLDRQATRG